MQKKKQSSIEWLVINYLGLHDEYNTLSLEEVVKQAKAMHKEEVMKAYDNGWHHNNEDHYNPIKYYTKTFGGQDNE